MNSIIYESNTGFTKQYAMMLQEKLHIPAYERKAKHAFKEPIIYMGWTFAGKIVGLRAARKKYKIFCVIGVGMGDPTEDYRVEIQKANQIEEPFFYLQGGLAPQKLKGIKKWIINMIGKMTIKENKPGNERVIQLFQEGGSYVDEKALLPILSFINEQDR